MPGKIKDVTNSQTLSEVIDTAKRKKPVEDSCIEDDDALEQPAPVRKAKCLYEVME